MQVHPFYFVLLLSLSIYLLHGWRMHNQSLLAAVLNIWTDCGVEGDFLSRQCEHGGRCRLCRRPCEAAFRQQESEAPREKLTWCTEELNWPRTFHSNWHETDDDIDFVHFRERLVSPTFSVGFGGRLRDRTNNTLGLNAWYCGTAVPVVVAFVFATGVSSTCCHALDTDTSTWKRWDTWLEPTSLLYCRGHHMQRSPKSQTSTTQLSKSPFTRVKHKELGHDIDKKRDGRITDEDYTCKHNYTRKQTLTPTWL